MKLFDREADKPEKVEKVRKIEPFERPAAAARTAASVEVDTEMDSSDSFEDEASMNTNTSLTGGSEKTRSGVAETQSRREEGLSVIGKTLFVKGQVEAAEDMLVEGRIEGAIKHTASRLIVGASGVVNADIDAKNLIIEGKVEGNIVGSESVVIQESADVRGNIYTARISIADGAQFSGTVDMDLSRTRKH